MALIDENISGLEAEYTPSLWSRRFQSRAEVLRHHITTITAASERALHLVQHKLEVEYGSTPGQKLDIFGTDLPDDAPILVYVHGGFWQELSRELSRYPAPALRRAGVKTVVVGYDLCPAVSLPDVVDQLLNDAPILVYVHGGFWQELSRELSRYPAPALRRAGVKTVVVGYDLCPAVSLPDVVDQLLNDAPILVYVHGGFWQELSRELSRYPAPALRRAGVKTVVVGYDLCPAVSLPDVVDQLLNDAPILVYVHGGFWQELSRELSRYPAPALRRAGVKTVVVGYDLCPAVSLPDVVDQLLNDAPILVYVHGGFWQELSRELSRYPAPALRRAGVKTVVVGYDLCPAVSLPDVVDQLLNDAPILVYVHGGFWQELSRELSRYPAPALRRAGVKTVVVGYDLCPAVSLPDVVDQLLNDAPILVYVHGGFWQELSRELSRYPAPALRRAGVKTVVVGYDLCPAVSLPDVVDQLLNDAPILVYVHGGFWQELSRELSRYPAPALRRAGVKTVVVGYDLCPAVSLPDVVDQLLNDAPILVYVHGGFWQELSRELSRYPAPALRRAGVKTVVVGYDLCPAVSLPDVVDQLLNDAPILVYVHGGFWQELSRELSRYPAPALRRAGVKTVVVGYDLCPAVSLPDVVDQLLNDAPILVYVHGGFWQELSRELSRYPAPALRRAGVKTVVVGYDLCPAVSLPDIVDQLLNAARFVFEYADRNDSRGVYFAGHSAGAHLLAKLLASADFLVNTPGSWRLQGAFLVSGIYDLTDLVHTSVNDALQLSRETALAMSPHYDTFYHLRDRRVRLYVLVAQHDSPTFKKQSRELYELLLNSCLVQNMHFEIKDDLDHFDIVESFANDINFLRNLMVHDVGKYL